MEATEYYDTARHPRSSQSVRLHPYAKMPHRTEARFPHSSTQFFSFGDDTQTCETANPLRMIQYLVMWVPRMYTIRQNTGKLSAAERVAVQLPRALDKTTSKSERS